MDNDALTESGCYDWVLGYMRKHKIKLTRANYLALDMPGWDPERELPAELECELPEAIQMHDGVVGWVQ